MDETLPAILGVQVTLVGLLLVTAFESVSPYPLVGLFLGGVGTVIVLASYSLAGE